jgi:hypothetical protein
MNEINLKITTTSDFRSIIQNPEIKLISEKKVTQSEYNALSPDQRMLLVSFLLSIPGSMIGTILLERIKSFIKKTGNEVIIQGRLVQIKLDPNSTQVDYENAVIELTPKE